jgi:hypothetical protein
LKSTNQIDLINIIRASDLDIFISGLNNLFLEISLCSTNASTFLQIQLFGFFEVTSLNRFLQFLLSETPETLLEISAISCLKTGLFKLYKLGLLL